MKIFTQGVQRLMFENIKEDRCGFPVMSLAVGTPKDIKPVWISITINIATIRNTSMLEVLFSIVYSVITLNGAL